MPPSLTTKLLSRLRDGDAAASGELLAVIYAELRDLAGGMMARERPAHTLQPTALVHEAWLKLVQEAGDGGFEDRRHFLRIAARAMRQVLVDHARGRRRDKRGGGRDAVRLDQVIDDLESEECDLVALDDALQRLGQLDLELQRVVELRFFAGLTIQESAEVLNRSTPTIERAWRLARAWLRADLGGA